MAITFDPAKRDKTLAERDLNFEDAEIVFAGVTLEVEDIRKDYGETRIICFGFLKDRIGSSGVCAARSRSPRFQYEES